MFLCTKFYILFLFFYLYLCYNFKNTTCSLPLDFSKPSVFLSFLYNSLKQSLFLLCHQIDKKNFEYLFLKQRIKFFMAITSTTHINKNKLFGRNVYPALRANITFSAHTFFSLFLSTSF